MKNKGKIIILLAIFCFLAYIGGFYQSLLKMAGNFMAPEKIESAEALIIESAEVIREKAIKMGLSLISQGKANLLVLVFQNSPAEKIFDRPRDYSNFLRTKLEKMGLRKEQIMVLEVPKEHPITLTEAQIVLPELTKKGIKKALLMVEGFHARRSFWVYRKIGEELGMQIYLQPFFLRYQKEDWWRNNQGLREFCAESVKYLYYLIRGYIPLKSLTTI